MINRFFQARYKFTFAIILILVVTGIAVLWIPCAYQKHVCDKVLREVSIKLMNCFWKRNQLSFDSITREIDSCQVCLTISPRLRRLKSNLLFFERRYQEVGDFVLTWPKSDFPHEIDKKISLYLSYTLYYDQKGDSISKLIYLRKGENLVQGSIDLNLDHRFDSTAYLNLYLFKNSLEDEKQIAEDIRLLKIKYPKNKNFINLLPFSTIFPKTVHEEEQVANPIR